MITSALTRFDKISHITNDGVEEGPVTKLIPVITPRSAACFCKRSGSDEPYTFIRRVSRNAAVTAGFLRVGRRMNLLSLASGEIDDADRIQDDVRLASVIVGSPDGSVIDVVKIPGRLTFVRSVHRPSNLLLDIDYRTVSLGRPLRVNMVGEIDLQTGFVELHAINSNAPDELTIIGYELDANRMNCNQGT